MLLDQASPSASSSWRRLNGLTAMKRPSISNVGTLRLPSLAFMTISAAPGVCSISISSYLMPFSAMNILVIRQSPHQLVVYILISAMAVRPPSRKCLTMEKTRDGPHAIYYLGLAKCSSNNRTLWGFTGKPAAARDHPHECARLSISVAVMYGRMKGEGRVEDRVRIVRAMQYAADARADPSWANPRHSLPLSVPMCPFLPGSPVSGTAPVPAPSGRTPGISDR